MFKVMIETEVKLEGCPFCGQAPSMYKSTMGGYGWVIHCQTKDCLCVETNSGLQTPEEAAAKWNKRAGR